MKHQIEIFSAGCRLCHETIAMVRRLAVDDDDIVVHEMQNDAALRKAAEYGVRSVPAVVVDGRLASCCAGTGPDEDTLRIIMA